MATCVGGEHRRRVFVLAVAAALALAAGCAEPQAPESGYRSLGPACAMVDKTTIAALMGPEPGRVEEQPERSETSEIDSAREYRECRWASDDPPMLFDGADTGKARLKIGIAGYYRLPDGAPETMSAISGFDSWGTEWPNTAQADAEHPFLRDAREQITSTGNRSGGYYAHRLRFRQENVVVEITRTLDSSATDIRNADVRRPSDAEIREETYRIAADISASLGPPGS